MTKEQIEKILKVLIIVTFVMFAFELLFNFDQITTPITDWIQGQQGWLIYLSIFAIMFIQVIIPIPAVVVISAALGVGILQIDKGLMLFADNSTWMFILVTMLAYMLGAIITYFIGRIWGKKAVIWCAGNNEEYEKWSSFLNRNKWYYAGTVILPLFPDDLLCLVAGATKLNFVFFALSNLIGRFIGLVTIIASLVIVGAGGNSIVSVILWSVLLIIELIIYFILKFKKTKKF